MKPDVTQLPATAVPESKMTAAPLDEIAVGDIVVVYSRGTNRLAQVTKTGPKRIEAVYTTQGAWASAEKIYANYTSPGFATADVAAVKRVSAKNYDHYVQEIDPATAVYNVVGDQTYNTPEEIAEATAKYVAIIGGRSKEVFVAEQVAASIADRTARAAEARDGGSAQYVHVTTKSVKRDGVFGLVASAPTTTAPVVVTRAETHLERPVTYVAAAKKIAALRGDAGRDGGWIYNRFGAPIAHGWRTYADRLHSAGLICQDEDHDAGNGKWYVWVIGLSAAELATAERLWSAS